MNKTFWLGTGGIVGVLLGVGSLIAGSKRGS
jgi:hypothetical protein